MTVTATVTVGLVGTPELPTFPRLAESLVAAGAAVLAIDPLTLAGRVTDGSDEPFLPGIDLAHLDGFLAPVAGAAAPAMGPALEALEALGLPTLNRLAARRTSRDKYATARALAVAGVPQPSTFLVSGAGASPAREVRARVADAIGYPLVVKGRYGSLGEQVRLAGDGADLERAVTELTASRSEEELLLYDEGLVLQAFVAEAAGRDRRIFVVDGRVVAAMERQAGPGEFRANVEQGATARSVELAPEEAAVALAAVRAVGLDHAGVDLVASRHGPLVLEVNHNAFFTMIERSSGVDVAGAIVDALLARIQVRRGAAPRR